MASIKREKQRKYQAKEEKNRQFVDPSFPLMDPSPIRTLLLSVMKSEGEVTKTFKPYRSKIRKKSAIQIKDP